LQQINNPLIMCPAHSVFDADGTLLSAIPMLSSVFEISFARAVAAKQLHQIFPVAGGFAQLGLALACGIL
jgi:hypothetical protein